MSSGDIEHVAVNNLFFSRRLSAEFQAAPLGLLHRVAVRGHLPPDRPRPLHHRRDPRILRDHAHLVDLPHPGAQHQPPHPRRPQPHRQRVLVVRLPVSGRDGDRRDRDGSSFNNVFFAFADGSRARQVVRYPENTTSHCPKLSNASLWENGEASAGTILCLGRYTRRKKIKTFPWPWDEYSRGV